MSDLTLFMGYVRARFGLVISSSRRRETEQKLRRLLERRGLSDVHRLLAELRSAPAESALVGELLDQFAIGETYFFRDPKQLAHVEHAILPALADQPHGVITLWSAGCATGEEAYTLAVIADRALPERACRVVGTDLVSRRLEHARRAIYRDYSLRRLPPAVRRDYFGPAADGRHRFLVDRLRCAVEFAQHDLLHGLPRSDVSLILCRNVLIYFDDPKDRSAVLRLFFDSLRPGGFLVLGHSESCAFETEGFEAAFTGGLLLLRKPLSGVPAPSRSPFRLPKPEEARAATGRFPVSLDDGGIVSAPPPFLLPPAPPPPPPAPLPPPEPVAAQPSGADAAPDIDSLVARAYAAADAGESDQAEALGRQALEAAPRIVQARILLASLVERRGAYAEARALLEEGLFLAPNSPALLFSCAAFCDRLGEPTEAARLRGLARRVVALGSGGDS